MMKLLRRILCIFIVIMMINSLSHPAIAGWDGSVEQKSAQIIKCGGLVILDFLSLPETGSVIGYSFDDESYSTNESDQQPNDDEEPDSDSELDNTLNVSPTTWNPSSSGSSTTINVTASAP